MHPARAVVAFTPGQCPRGARARAASCSVGISAALATRGWRARRNAPAVRAVEVGVIEQPALATADGAVARIERRAGRR
eukprot:SAG11_NODE_207_length_12378_cov_8.404105_1_plen_79_part_00